mmetsp:Transcript_53128/g.166920  ORF Transcript_53128/g.166920 Transcript_53128/m.166920 type:complete len:287 (+) Transcript_53128:175-1035(+)
MTRGARRRYRLARQWLSSPSRPRMFPAREMHGPGRRLPLSPRSPRRLPRLQQRRDGSPRGRPLGRPLRRCRSPSRRPLPSPLWRGRSPNRRPLPSGPRPSRAQRQLGSSWGRPRRPSWRLRLGRAPRQSSRLQRLRRCRPRSRGPAPPATPRRPPRWSPSQRPDSRPLQRRVQARRLPRRVQARSGRPLRPPPAGFSTRTSSWAWTATGSAAAPRGRPRPAAPQQPPPPAELPRRLPGVVTRSPCGGCCGWRGPSGRRGTSRPPSRSSRSWASAGPPSSRRPWARG